MTKKTYDLPAIVAQVRSAGNPQMAAIQAIADTDGLEDAELLEALWVVAFGDIPRTPYADPDNPTADTGPDPASTGAKPPRKKPGPKPGSWPSCEGGERHDQRILRPVREAAHR